MPHISIVFCSNIGSILLENLFIYLYHSYVSVSSSEATCVCVACSQNACFNNVNRDLVFVAHFPSHREKNVMKSLFRSSNLKNEPGYQIYIGKLEKPDLLHKINFVDFNDKFDINVDKFLRFFIF